MAEPLNPQLSVIGDVVSILRAHGVTNEEFTDLLANPIRIARIVASFRNLEQGNSFDVGSILGLGTEGDTPLPKAFPGEIIVRLGAWTPLELCVRAAEMDLVSEHWEWIRTQVWSEAYRQTPGVYGLVFFPVKDRWEYQRLKLPEPWECTGLTPVLSTLLCALKTHQPNPAHHGQILCPELVAHCQPVGVFVHNDRVILSKHMTGSEGNLWGAAIRRIS